MRLREPNGLICNDSVCNLQPFSILPIHARIPFYSIYIYNLYNIYGRFREPVGRLNMKTGCRVARLMKASADGSRQPETGA
jgi:hypothetical protein